jgi:hypothetical protein
MLAGRYNIVCDQGSTFEREIELMDSDETPYNLSGYTARMQVRREVDSTGTPLIELTTENGRISLFGTLGIIALALTPTETSSLSRGGYYDLEIVQTSTGKVFKVLRGEFRLEKEVTR